MTRPEVSGNIFNWWELLTGYALWERGAEL